MAAKKIKAGSAFKKRGQPKRVRMTREVREDLKAKCELIESYASNIASLLDDSDRFTKDLDTDLDYLVGDAHDCGEILARLAEEQDASDAKFYGTVESEG